MHLKQLKPILSLIICPIMLSATAQPAPTSEKIVIVTGARFSYPLVQHWIDTYNKVNPDVQLIIESRGANDPHNYDLLIEAYEPTDEARKTREHIYIARYPIVPVANANGQFATTYAVKGLNRATLKQVFFADVTAGDDNTSKIQIPYTVYSRLQRAGVPITFSSYFGYQQKDLKGKHIAGSDEHLLKAVLRDSTAITCLPLTLAYENNATRAGLTIIPVDLNNNGKVTVDENIYADLQQVVRLLEAKKKNELTNMPMGYLHFSVSKTNPNRAALEFLHWVIQNGQDDLHQFGYLLPEPDRLQKESFEKFMLGSVEQ